MKTQKLLIFCMALSIVQFTSRVYADVTKTVGATGADYPTLTAAFSAINAGGEFDGSAVTLQIIASTTGEAATLNGPVHYSSVTIYPTVSGLSISGSGNVLTFDGATNITIDGRVNGAGTANLIINNTTGPFKVITFTNGSQYNTVRYCNIQCSTGGKAVNFTTSAIAGGNGYNTISNNVITNYNNTRPTYGIYSSGSDGYPNTGNIIRDNEFKDLMTTSGYGIYLEGATNPTSTGWSITGNSFYETTSFVPAAASTYIFMQLGVGTGSSQRAGTDFTISGNYIGGTEKNCGGAAMSKTSAFNFNLTGIQLFLANGGTNSIQNNTIKNISWTNTNSSNVIGISLGYSGASTVTNIGTETGNSIGDNTTTGSITVTNGATSTANGFTGISIGTSVSGATYCQNNKIGSVTTANTLATAATNLWAINRGIGSGATVISNNVIGSATVANSLNCSSTSTGTAQTVAGILCNGSGTNTIENNTIANLTNGITSTTAGDYSAYGINCGGGGRISNNTVYNISSGSGYNTKTISGIVITDNGNTSLIKVSGNTISGISSGSASYTGFVNGIFQSAGTSDTISGNFIHSITANESSTASNICGIRFFGAKLFIKNNIVFLGGNTNSVLCGIQQAPTSANDSSKIYHNTVYISGTPVAGANKSYACYLVRPGNTFSNNLFVNARSNGGTATAKHIALHADVSANAVGADNDLYAPNTGGYVGELNTTAYQTLEAWQTARGAYEVNSLNVDPLFATGGGTTATDYKTSSSVALSGAPLAEVKTDYAGNARDNTTPRMGAYESTWVPTAIGSNTEADQAVVIYKNANNQIEINGHAIGHEGKVTIYNAVGQKIFCTQTTGATTVISQSFSHGLYLVTVNVAGKVMTGKVIIK